MRKMTEKWLWGALALAIILGIIWQLTPLPNASDRVSLLPLRGPQYVGQELFLTPFEEKFFQGVHVVKRAYLVGDQALFITVLDGTENRHVVHDPYYCFRGAGWAILSEKSVLIPGGEARLLEIEKDGVKKEALFWFSDQRERYTSALTYWWQTTFRRITLGLSGPEPVLVMVQPLKGTTIDLHALESLFPTLFTF